MGQPVMGGGGTPASGQTRHISIDTIRDATDAISAIALRTPIVPLDPLGSHATQTEILLKLETLQPIGSFKIRGAANAVNALTHKERDQGVWTVSAVNAAQGVALAARAAGVRCSILLIDTAPRTKIDAIEQLGARIVKASYDDCWNALVQHDEDRLPGRFVHPFDDDRFISGNGTIGVEILEDLSDVDAVVAAVGGGGLLAGVATAVRALSPGTKVYAAEPETAAPLMRSFERGKASVFEEWRASFVDGCGGKSVLPTMWPLLRDLVDDSIVVSLDEIAQAMRLVARQTHIIAEGAGACAVAAALSGRVGAGRVVAIVSGGNIDLSTFSRLVSDRPATAQ